MGMFDNIQGEVKCLNCGKEFIAEEQIKWTDYCTLQYHNIGDTIPAEDGEYDYGSWIRPTLKTQCPYCKTWQNFKATIKNGILERLDTTEIFDFEERYRKFYEKE